MVDHNGIDVDIKESKLSGGLVTQQTGVVISYQEDTGGCVEWC